MAFFVLSESRMTASFAFLSTYRCIGAAVIFPMTARIPSPLQPCMRNQFYPTLSNTAQYFPGLSVWSAAECIGPSILHGSRVGDGGSPVKVRTP
ncbi:uncharacterized protein BO80DRAFT_421587 [Aspergillus ibericus CBS 121593]|uniref:Uncharacterized protein n=1 Tax=Aspergillus ibericus CBS 121593 TaxID=1448316 RepID=A0A395HB73_9EURO|nr:hypothetical protein BO80DRAFT_421587 [Aspergillus ibericus CBS 121593]RAL04940.1 hypothetical protein BO80DRAFT_421587 [Aspergillus ibericus CBS 121593]